MESEQRMCTVHDRKIKQMESDINNISIEMNRRFDLLTVKIDKPILNDKQVGMALVMTVVYTIGIMMYLSPISARGESNERDNIRQDKELLKQEEFTGKVYKLLLDIKTTVDKNEGAKEALKSQKNKL